MKGLFVLIVVRTTSVQTFMSLKIVFFFFLYLDI